jgi:hypothetical protein
MMPVAINPESISPRYLPGRTETKLSLEIIVDDISGFDNFVYNGRVVLAPVE